MLDDQFAELLGVRIMLNERHLDFATSIDTRIRQTYGCETVLVIATRDGIRSRNSMI